MTLQFAISITLSLLLLSACTPASQTTTPTQDLEATIAAQSTGISRLAARQEEQHIASTIASLDTLVAYLATEVSAQRSDGLLTPAPPGPPTPTPYRPSPTVRVYPPGARTSVDSVNQVIDAFLSGDLQARKALVRYTQTACANVDGLGGPPQCNPGEQDGTIVEVFPLSDSEGHFTNPEFIDGVLDFPVAGLYAVYRVPADAYEADYWPAGQYGIIFILEESDMPNSAIGVIVDQGQVVRLDYYFGDWLYEDYAARGGEALLPPLEK